MPRPLQVKNAESIYSEYGRRRFARWLKKKYGIVEALNEAWAARRWSRKLESFDDVVFPENEVAVGSPESWLDMRRFWGDGISQFLVKLKKIVEEGAPGVSHSSNHYGEKANLGFDYLKVCRDFVDYPGYEVGEKYQYLYSVYMQRLGELGKPMWCLEFQAGSKGVFAGPKGAVRMQALLCLMHRGQMILGWTWRSMLGGEEQYLYGLLTHDGVPGPVYEEYKRLAGDMRKLEKYGFPYLPKPDIGVAYNYDSSYVTYYANHQFRQEYGKAVGAVTEIKQPIDFLGINHYFCVKDSYREGAFPLEAESRPCGTDFTEMGWGIYPQEIYDLLIRLNRDYGNVPIYITENGAAFRDMVTEGGRVPDGNRIEYLRRYLKEVLRAIEDAVPVKGYFVWSFMDNFEWGLGFSRRFGLVHVDYETKKRTVKDSGYWYRDVIEANEIVDER